MLGVIYPIVLFYECVSCSACIVQMRSKRNQFLNQIKVYFFIVCCFLSWNFRVIIHNFITFRPFPKDLHCFLFISISIELYILFWNLHCFLQLVLLVIYFNSYGWEECLRTTLAGFSVGGVHWQWPWTLLRIDPRVLGDILHSVMFPSLYLF